MLLEKNDGVGERRECTGLILRDVDCISHTRNRPEVLVDSSLQQYKVVVVMEDGLMEL